MPAPTSPLVIEPGPQRAPRGTDLHCQDWHAEAALRMFLNNLDPEVGEDPANLVVYGGTGRAANAIHVSRFKCRPIFSCDRRLDVLKRTIDKGFQVRDVLWASDNPNPKSFCKLGSLKSGQLPVASSSSVVKDPIPIAYLRHQTSEAWLNLS